RAARGPPRRPALGRSRRTDRRCHSAGRRAALAASRAWPIAEPGRSSGRCGPRLQTRFQPASSRAGRRHEPSARAGSFFESLDGPLALSWMTGPRTDVGEAQFLEELSDIARMKVDTEPLGDDAFEVEPTPAHDPVLLTIRTRLDDLRELSQLLCRKTRLGTLRPVVDEALQTRPVEAMDPVAQRLAVHPADLRRRARSMPSRTAASDRSRRLWWRPSTAGRAPEAPQPNNPLP